MRTPFLGGHKVARSLNLADQQVVNLYPEVIKGGRDVGAFYMCPGLDLLTTLGNGPIRGSKVMAGVLYVVSGNGVYSVAAGSWASKLLGTINSNMGPVDLVTNGTQLAIFDGVGGTLVTTAGAVSAIALPFSGQPVTTAYQDGFGLVNVLGTQQWYQSNLKDLSTWQSLNFTSSDGQPDNVVALLDLHREVWVLKQNDSEVWINAGLPGFAFQRLDGVFLEHGCGATFSRAKLGDELFWLQSNEQGQGMAVKAAGYKPERISTHAMESIWATYPTISDAIGYAYQQEGHEFYVLTFPTGNATWVYDAAASREAGEPLWHQRAALLNGQLQRHWSNSHSFFGGKNIVGDFQNGKLYAFNLNTALDNGTQRKWVRSWRALPRSPEYAQRHLYLTLDMETGMGVPDGTNPQVQLRWSDDGGHNWSQPVLGSVGMTGETGRQVKFTPLGSTIRGGGLDRIYEISSSDQFKVSLMGANLEL